MENLGNNESPKNLILIELQNASHELGLQSNVTFEFLVGSENKPIPTFTHDISNGEFDFLLPSDLLSSPFAVDAQLYIWHLVSRMKLCENLGMFCKLPPMIYVTTSVDSLESSKSAAYIGGVLIDTVLRIAAFEQIKGINPNLISANIPNLIDLGISHYNYLLKTGDTNALFKVFEIFSILKRNKPDSVMLLFESKLIKGDKSLAFIEGITLLYEILEKTLFCDENIHSLSLVNLLSAIRSCGNNLEMNFFNKTFGLTTLLPYSNDMWTIKPGQYSLSDLPVVKILTLDQVQFSHLVYGSVMTDNRTN